MAFDPDKYLSTKVNKKSSGGFDPDAYLASTEIGGDWEVSYGSASQHEATRRLQERAGGQPQQPTEFRRFSEHAQPDSGTAIGDALYAATNFGGIIPKGVALGETITGERPIPEGNFSDNLQANLDIENEVARQRAERSPTATKVGDIAGDIAAYLTGTNLLKSAPIIGEVAGGNKVAEFVKMIGRGGATQASVGQLRGHDTSDIPRDFGLGAAGETITPVLSLLSKGFKSLSPKLVNSVLKPSAKELERGKNIGQEVVDRGIVGTQGSLKKTAEKGLEETENLLQSSLTKAEQPINKQHIIDELEKVKKKYAAARDSRSIAAIDRQIAKVNAEPELTAAEANIWKRGIYNTAPKVWEKSFDTLKDSLTKATARGLKKSVEEVVPEAKELNKKLSFYGRLKDNIVKNEAQGAKKFDVPLSWKDTMLGGLIGAGTANPVLGGAALGTKALLNTTPGATGTAQLLKYLSEVLDKASPIGRLVAPVAGEYLNNN